MITKKQNIAIIGAGISGLSLANMLKDRVHKYIIEISVKNCTIKS
jgi:predicted NAD/FAD-binding protein